MPPGVAGTPPIAIEGLSKRYGRLHALTGLSLDVRQGEVFGFLGLNGAGKTTTIRLLLDLIRPSGGRAAVFGHDCRREGVTVRRLVGYLPGEPSFYPDMTGERLLCLLGHLGGGVVDPRWRSDLLDRFGLGARDLRRRIRDYSSGMKRKLAIVQAVQHDPPLLILDEPTEGLDPLMQDRFYGMVRELTARGRTVFLSSHVLSEVERTCDRVAVLREGRLALLASVGQLCSMAPRLAEVRFTADTSVPPALPEGLSARSLGAREWVIEVRGVLAPLLAILRDRPVADLRVQEARLEDILVRYYEEEP